MNVNIGDKVSVMLEGTVVGMEQDHNGITFYKVKPDMPIPNYSIALIYQQHIMLNRTEAKDVGNRFNNG